MKRYIIALFVLCAAIATAQTSHNSKIKEPVSESDTTIVRMRSSDMDSDNVLIPKIIPSSPQSQIFEQYINHNISEYNGLPDISINLFDIEIKGMTIPITLSYHASGIKYKQFDGDLGAGWSINAGGYRVSRTIYGKPDEKNKMYDPAELNRRLNMSYHYSKESYLANIGLNISETYPISNCIPQDRDCGTGRISLDQFDGYLDGEYDLFNYNLPSTSGHFIISDRSDMSVSVANNKLDKIKINVDSMYTVNRGYIKNIPSMQITDGNGFTYSLGGANSIEQARTNDSFDGWIASSWLLKSIRSAYNESVNFNYSSHQPLTNRELNTVFHLHEAAAFKHDYYGAPEAPSELCDCLGETTTSSSALYTTVMPAYSFPTMQYLDNITTDNLTVRFVRDNIYSCNSNGFTNLCSSHVIKEIHIEDKSGNLIKKISFTYGISPANANPQTSEIPWHRLLTGMTIGVNGQNEKKYNFDYYNAPSSSGVYIPDQWGYYALSTGIRNSYYKNLYIHEEFANDIFLHTTGRSYANNGVLNGTGGYNNLITFRKRSANDAAPDYFSLKRITYPTGGFTEYEYEPHQQLSAGMTIKGGGLRIKKIKSYNETNEKSVVTSYKYGINEDGNGIANLNHLDYANSFADETYHISKRFVLSRYPRCLFDEFNTLETTKQYSNNPMYEDVQAFYRISYPEVSIYQYDKDERISNGKTVVKYNISHDARFGNMGNRTSFNTIARNFNGNSNRTSRAANLFVSSYTLGNSPTLQSKTIYDKEGRIILKEEYEYLRTPIRTFQGIKVRQKYTFDRYLSNPSNPSHYFYTDLGFITAFNYDFTNVILATNLLASKTVTTFHLQHSQQKEFTSKEIYYYNDRFQLVQKQKENSNNKISRIYYKYPHEYSDNVLRTMVSNNILSPVVEEYVVNERGIEIGRKKTNYGIFYGLYLPASIETSKGGSLKNMVSFDQYTEKGNIRQYTTSDGQTATYLWGYKEMYPIAEIKNATYTQVKNVLGETLIYRLASSISPSVNDVNTLNDLRRLLPVAHISTFGYKPFIGMSSQTDSRGIKINYEYDMFGRLQYIKDYNQYIMNGYEYKYKNY